MDNELTDYRHCDDFENPYVVRCILVGNHNVGKSTLANVFATGEFNPNIPSTIGIAFVCKEISLINYNNHGVKLQLWDTAGQEKFKSIVKQYLRDAYIAIIAFDITDRESWEAVDEWRDEIMNEKEYNSIPQIILVATKADLIMKRQVDLNEIKRKADKWDCKYYVLSAKQRMSRDLIHRMFHMATEDLHKQLLHDHYNNIKVPPKIYGDLNPFSMIDSKEEKSCCYK